MASYTGLGAALLALLAAGALASCGPEADAQGASGASFSVPLGRVSSTTETVNVRMEDFGYAPRRVRVRPGDRVRWTDADRAPHTGTAEQHAAGRFDTGRVISGHGSTAIFTKPGRYPYYCRFHPFMVGTVEVVH